jgi:molybdate transport system regulatory protein
LGNALGDPASDKRLDVLRLVGQSGSISQAAREVGISYKAAWQAIDTLTNLSGVALVDRTVGGSGGGGARITQQGQELLALAKDLAAARLQVLARFAGGLQLASGLGLRTSMRNNLPCQVLQLIMSTPGDPMVRVVLVLPQGAQLTSLITRESAELLDLQPGLALLALCKATALRVVPAHDGIDGSVANHIMGKVARLSRGSQRDEVVMTLPGELQLVGFADHPNRLRVGSKVCAQVEENAVVLARV